MPERLLAGYAAPDDRYDELLAAPGRPRPHWDAFMRSLAERSEREVSDTLSLTERQIREHGITYNVYADAAGRAPAVGGRPDPAGPAGRRVGDDRGGHRAARRPAEPRPRRPLRRAVAAALGALPPLAVFGHSGFLAPAEGLRPAGGLHLLQYAADLARSPDGRWWVSATAPRRPRDRATRSRTGSSSRASSPHVPRAAGAAPGAFFDALRSSLLHWAPRGDGPTRIVLLTPGPYNETYFEHALLARYLGFALVEGAT
jgi:uncharacterized circularly permuted ATP-grasp superfamily protein